MSKIDAVLELAILGIFVWFIIVAGALAFSLVH